MSIDESYRGPGGKTLPGPRKDVEKGLRELQETFRGSGVRLAYLFGSRARGESREDSDVDLGILTEEGIRKSSVFKKIYPEIRKTLASEKFDLVFMEDSSIAFQYEIIAEGEPVYSENETSLQDFEAQVLGKYQDTAQLRNVQNAYLRKRARNYEGGERKVTLKKDSIIERLKKLEEIMGELEKWEDLARKEFREDREKQWVIERGLELASSTILDIGNHILSSAYNTSPSEYEEIIEKMGQKGIISEELFQDLKGLGGFRKLLVHNYLEIDEDLVYDHFQTALSSFPQFIAEIDRWLEDYFCKKQR